MPPAQTRPRDERSPAEKQASFAAAFKVIEEHRRSGSPLAAYVLAFSVFEDRLAVASIWGHDIAQRARPKGHVMLVSRVNQLKSDGHISPELAQSWTGAAKERNELIHQAMWHFDVVTDEHVAASLRVAREADKLARQLRRKAAKMTHLDE